MTVETISIGYGVAAMASWGFGDFMAKRVVGSVGYYRLVLYVQLVAVGPLLLLAGVFAPPLPSSPSGLALVIATGICSFSAVFFFYKGIAVGKASIVSPIACSSAIVAVGLSFLILGETLSPVQLLCIAMAFVGVVIVTITSGSHEGSNAGIPYALAAMVSAGSAAVLIKLASIDIGEIATLFFNRIVVLLIVLIVAILPRGPLSADVPGNIPLKSVIAVGLAEFMGFCAFAIGIGVGIVSIVTPLRSASPVVTVMLAQVFLKERLASVQRTGVIMAIAGIVLLSISSA